MTEIAETANLDTATDLEHEDEAVHRSETRAAGARGKRKRRAAPCDNCR